MENAHKRTKSGGVKSLLQRVSSRSEGSDPSERALSPSPSSSSLQSQQAPPSVRSQHTHQGQTSRHRPHLSTTMSPAGQPDSQQAVSPIQSQRPSSPSSPAAKGASIEQSVKLFRIFEALRSGDTAAISRAIRDRSSVSDNDKQSEVSTAGGRLEGTSVLHLAIQCAELPVIEYVLSNASLGKEYALDINERDRDGNTPLHLAASLGRTPVVLMLLEQPDINDSITNYQGQTALDLARTPEIFQQLQLARSILIDTSIKKIHQLVASSDYSGLETLLVDPRIRTTLDVNGGELATDQATLESGGTLLHEAARKRDIKLIQMLLLNGADPFRRDRKGKLPQDVTKDDRTRAILKRSPAAAAAQRGIQEKTILGGATPQVGSSSAESTLGSKEGREMKGYLKKWTNYTSGYKLRWFVLEDGVLSYYKHQDDAGSACRGAINMRIAKLYMDPQDKLRFEIQGKSSVKYHLKANHQVEAKRWYWALNNAIQWAKDEAREEEKRQKQESDALKQAKMDQVERFHTKESDATSTASSKAINKGTATGSSLTVPTASNHSTRTGASTVEDEEYVHSIYDPSISGAEMRPSVGNMGPPTVDGDHDDEEDYGDDASSHDMQPASKDAFNITAQSAKLQLELLGQVSIGLQAEGKKNPTMHISDPIAAQALGSYEAAVSNLKGLLGDLLRISRDRDAYWQFRLDREANVRRMWEESMARVAMEQEELETRIGESELKRKKTKKALREALENFSGEGSRPLSRDGVIETDGSHVTSVPETVDEEKTPSLGPQKSMTSPLRKKPAFVDMPDLSEEDSDEEEFFDAVGAGEVEVVEMPAASPSLIPEELPPSTEKLLESKSADLQKSFAGYEDPPRDRLRMDEDNRPKISLWAILKSMIGKDMTKMTLPVSFNEPTSLLQRVAEDMEYTDLLDTAADRVDSTERMVYVAAFAASEYASTIGRVAKPFNPLLGETYEYARPDKGYRFFIEQVSHHPPIGAAFAESAKWDYYGESAVKSKFYGKSFDINPLGTWFLRLRPVSGGSELYTWKKVTSSVVGIITGNPTVDNYGVMEIKNWNTGEVCILDFKPRGWKASSAYQVAGKVVDARGHTRWSIGGRWNDKIYARLTPGFEDTAFVPSNRQDGSSQAVLIWESHARPTGIPFNLTPFVVTLNALTDNLKPCLPPTDTRLRPDQRAMEDGEYDLAATEKHRVEEKQRAKRREREARGEDFMPKWFSKGRCEVTGEEYWEFSGKYWRMRDDVTSNKGQWVGPEDIF